MPDPSMPEREFPKLWIPGTPTSSAEVASARTHTEAGLAELAAVFAAHGGGGLSPQLSADLALEIVLNDIVEQAAFATGATGAAIALSRDGEMVCRASSGVNAPDIGARLDSEFGLTAECVRTAQVQRCENAQADPRADVEASRNLGARSVLIIPLLRQGELAGVLEAFSSRPAAFTARDEVTLQGLAKRISSSLDQASETVSVSSREYKAPEATQAAEEPVTADEFDAVPKVMPGLESMPKEDSRLEFEPLPELEPKLYPDVLDLHRVRRGGIDVVTVALAAAMVLCAVLVGVLLGVRMAWSRKVSAGNRVPAVSERVAEWASPLGEQTDTQASSTAGNPVAKPDPAPATAAKKTLNAGRENKSETQRAASASASAKWRAPAGSLLVYENGKEIFRMLPDAEPNAERRARNVATARGNAEGGNSSLEPVSMIESEVTEGILLHRVQPDYPEEAKRQKIEGPVVLNVRIGDDGRIEEVKVLSGHPVLADAAIAAVKQWRFQPRLLAGRPVEMQTRVTLNFRMKT